MEDRTDAMMKQTNVTAMATVEQVNIGQSLDTTQINLDEPHLAYTDVGIANGAKLRRLKVELDKIRSRSKQSVLTRSSIFSIRRHQTSFEEGEEEDESGGGGEGWQGEEEREEEE